MPQSKSNFTVIDLFAGVGGFSLGAERAGFHVLGAAEIDKKARETHQKNFSNTYHFTDVTKLNESIIFQKLATLSVDGIIGGPPCQGFSSIGRRNTTDVRNSLFHHFFRIVAELRPKFFIAENVPGILDPKFDAVIQSAISHLPANYQTLSPMVFNAKDYGAPTIRKRVFFIGYDMNNCPPMSEGDFQPPKGIRKVTVSKALRGLPKVIDPDWQLEEQSWQVVDNYGRSAFAKHLSNNIPNQTGCKSAINRLTKREVSGFLGTKHTHEVVQRFEKLKQGEVDKPSRAVRLNPRGFCPTLRAGTGSDRGGYQAVRPIHPSEPRVITPREAARLQGFPDWFQFHPTKWHSFRQIGNSVSPLLAEYVLQAIRSLMESEPS